MSSSREEITATVRCKSFDKFTSTASSSNCLGLLKDNVTELQNLDLTYKAPPPLLLERFVLKILYPAMMIKLLLSSFVEFNIHIHCINP